MATSRNGEGRRGTSKGSASAQKVADAHEALSLPRIVAAAVALLDEDGIEGLAMRRLAERLDAGVMSLYWHVKNKDAVLDLALDAVLSPKAEVARDGDERARIVAQLEDWRRAMLAHPWASGLLPRRALGPAMLARLERLAATLLDAGVPPAELNAAVWSLWNMVIGATATRVSFAAGAAERGATPLAISSLAASSPTIAALRLLEETDWNGVFRHGLDRLLDGLAPIAPARRDRQGRGSA